VRFAQWVGRPEYEASEPYLFDIGVPLKGFLQKNAYHFLQQEGLGGLCPLCEDCLSFAVVASEFWSLQKKVRFSEDYYSETDFRRRIRQHFL